ncbi:unnamed protein product [Sphagnum troendelagicum]|uniref:Uncharacterized protein n=1 Tax=Sphagnum troendelagicum TaxID=128251 RepID=A0ABP0TSG4_9BRYO
MHVRMILCDRSVFHRDIFRGRITRDEHDRHENDRVHHGFEIHGAVIIHAIGEGHREAVRVGRPIPLLSYLKFQNFKVFIKTPYRRVRPGPRSSFIPLSDEAKFGVFKNREMRVQ